MPASPLIEKPTQFAQWIQTKRLFDDDTTLTETYVTDGHEPGTRYAYGKSPAGWHFYITMTPAEEPIFWQTYREWVKRSHAGNHHILSALRTNPPNCGTPTTPQCPDATGGQESLLTVGPNKSSAGKAA